MGRRISNDEILNRLKNIGDFSNYTIDEQSIEGTTKKAKFTHVNCPENNLSDFNFNMIIKDFLKGQRCPACAAKNRIISNTKRHKDTQVNINNDFKKCKTIDTYVDRINNKDDKYMFISLSDSTFHGVHTKVNIRHNDCGNTFIKRISDFIYNNQLCPLCTGSGGKKKDIKDTIERISARGFELVGEHNTLYTHASYMMRCVHYGEEQERRLNTIINLSGKCQCQSRKISTGEALIKEILNEFNINFIRGKTFETLRDISTLKYDFYIKDFNAIIEYDGRQHFIYNSKSIYKEDPISIQKRDIIKNNFAIDNNIKILRISYKEKNKSKITNIIREFLELSKSIDGKPYDGKLSRTVWVGGKSKYEDYIKYNS